MRQELNQARHNINQHNRTGWMAIAVIVLLYCIVGAVERLA